MIVDLTSEQAEQLGPLFNTVMKADAMSLTGMLVAQVIRDRDTGHAYMQVGFVKHHQAKQLVKAATERAELVEEIQRSLVHPTQAEEDAASLARARADGTAERAVNELIQQLEAPDGKA